MVRVQVHRLQEMAHCPYYYTSGSRERKNLIDSSHSIDQEQRNPENRSRRAWPLELLFLFQGQEILLFGQRYCRRHTGRGSRCTPAAQRCTISLYDLKKQFWWHGMKGDLAEFISRCLTCQQVKAEHQKPAGLLQLLPVAEWKWEHITMDFVSGLPLTRNKHDSAWVIHDQLELRSNAG